MKALVRSVLPASWRRRLRDAVQDLPARMRDLVPDTLEAVGGRRHGPPLPPPRLRRSVGRTCSRREFVDVGRVAANQLLAVAAACGDAPSTGDPRRWLDFGCGSGRVARHLGAVPGLELVGVDVDRDAVAWADRHLSGSFVAIGRDPPLPFGGDEIDLVYAISVFTHLDEAAQVRWLAELIRVLGPGGLLVATTHNESLVWSRPDLGDDQHAELAARGVLFAPGGGPFNENSTFHTRAYLEATWGEHLLLESFVRFGLRGYQDLSVWRTGR
jgi:SAM-dependent methyltransferase